MDAAAFQEKWRQVELKERSAAQEHFLDLCQLVGHPTPAAADPTGLSFCFEKGATKQGGGGGFADVWKQGFFGFEYKGRHQNLTAAYNQLLLYRDALANPPLLVVCDFDRLIVHSNFTGTVSQRHEISLDQLDQPRNLEILHALFFDPEALRPGTTSEAVTQEAARQFASLAESLRQRGLEAERVAHFLDRVVFCLFAEDIELLPDQLFTRIVDRSRQRPASFPRFVGQLFEAMAGGGEFGIEDIRHFNGSLFDDASCPELTRDELQTLATAARLDWSAVDPAIFGTLFERGLDPAKRSQLGAHFTGRADIELLIEAVVMQPLRREWDDLRQAIDTLLATGLKEAPTIPTKKPLSPAARRKAQGEAESLLHRFLVRLQSVKILDPACGSGNFLYVALLELKNLEKTVLIEAQNRGLGSFLPLVGPWQLYGLEVNPYAHDLAQTTVWIGWLQWIRANGFGLPQEPILRPLRGNFRCQDAILDLADPDHPVEPAWPTVDFIVGNPPFLGDKLMRRELGDAYVDRLRQLYAGRLPGQSDLCCYWFEKARAQLAAGHCRRAGLLATQSIRGGANRQVLQRLKESGDIFWAIADQNWILNGANVHISMIAFDNGDERQRQLDGRPVDDIAANLTGGEGVHLAARLAENAGLGFIGVTQKAPFDADDAWARQALATPNPHCRPSSDVLRPICNAADLTRRSRLKWNVDFGVDLGVETAARYEMPFELVCRQVRPLRVSHREARQTSHWWLFARPCPDLRKALAPLPRYLATPRVAKHRLFVWLTPETLCDSAVVAFARDDDYFFGVLHSRFHELWALAQGTQLEDRPRYTPTTCFETFPFPWPPGQTPPATDPRVGEIAAAARQLCELRNNWLNPPAWTREELLEFPATVGGPWDRFIANPRATPATTLQVQDSPDATIYEFHAAERAVRAARERARRERPLLPGEVGLARYARLIPRDAEAAQQLAQRTLTNLYNQRPAWLADAHHRLDQAVAAAYGWPTVPSDRQALEKLLELNHQRSGNLLPMTET